MKLAIVNYSGNVGKSTIARQLPALALDPSASTLAVESVNADSFAGNSRVRRMDINQFDDLLKAVVKLDDVIVNVGSSCFEQFAKSMAQYAGCEEEFDGFIVPVVGQKKQIEDSASTIQTLNALGVSPNKIRVVMNLVDVRARPAALFEELYLLAAVEKSFVIEPTAVIYRSEVFSQLDEVDMSLSELANDQTDWRARVRLAANDEEAEYAIHRLCLKRIAVTTAQNLRGVFATLLNGLTERE